MKAENVDEFRAECKRLRADGLTFKAIAAKLGRSYEAVYAHCSQTTVRKIQKTEGLNWVHPPHIPLLPIR